MFWNLPCGNKGQVFSLDAVIAIFLVMIVLISSFFMVNKENEENYELLQQFNLGNDIFTVLDVNGKLNSLNRNSIKTSIETILPKNFDYSFRLECEHKIVESNRSVSSTLVKGEKIVVTNNLDLCIMRYGIWPK
ncbi:MAG: hypothetical protein AABX29_04805 [Nanoarchaeota archaeon]